MLIKSTRVIFFLFMTSVSNMCTTNNITANFSSYLQLINDFVLICVFVNKGIVGLFIFSEKIGKYLSWLAYQQAQCLFKKDIF